jgi:hypothetical protein
MHLRMSDGNYGLGLGPAFEAVPVEQRETEKKIIHGKSKGLGKGGTRQFMICEVVLNLIQAPTLLPRILEICVTLSHAILQLVVHRAT